MALPLARSGEERQLVTAIQHVLQGRTAEQSVRYMTGQYNLMSEVQAFELYRQAEQAVAQGRVMSSQIEEIYGGIPRAEYAAATIDREAVAIVTIHRPGLPDEIKQIRVRIPGGRNVGYVLDEVESVADSWISKYGVEGAFYDYEIAYVR